jgi:site-specific DNA-methyltransferase (adenine-specific)
VHDGSEGNNHPTVKPTDLMRWLVRLVTPPGGVVLDPFMGSGSTGRAAIMEALSFIGIERDEHSHAIASTRIGSAGAIQPAEQPTNDPQKLLWEIIT